MKAGSKVKDENNNKMKTSTSISRADLTLLSKCNCSIEFQTKPLGLQQHAYNCKISINQIVLAHENNWIIQKVTVEDIISCTGDTFAFLLSRLITLKANMYGVTVCPQCLKDNERSRTKKPSKSAATASTHPPVSAADRNDRTFIGFMKHLLACGYYSICSVILMPKLSSQKIYDSIVYKNMVGLLVPTAFSQGVIYFYPDDLDSFRKVVYTAPTVKVHRSIKSRADGSRAITTCSKLVEMEDSTIAMPQNVVGKIELFQENLFREVTQNALFHGKPHELPVNETSFNPDYRSFDTMDDDQSDAKSLMRAASVETITSGLSNFEDVNTIYDNSTQHNDPSTEPSLVRSSSDDGSNVFQNIQNDDLAKENGTVSQDSINLYTSATGFEDTCQEKIYAPSKSTFMIENSASAIHFPSFLEETNQSSHEPQNLRPDKSNSSKNSYPLSLFGVVSNMLSMLGSRQLSSQKPVSGIMDFSVVEGTKLDNLLYEEEESASIFRQLEIQSQLKTCTRFASKDETSHNDNPHVVGEVLLEDTLSTLRDDLSVAKYHDSELNKKLDSVSQSTLAQENKQKVFAELPELSSLPRQLVESFLDCIFSRSGSFFDLLNSVKAELPLLPKSSNDQKRSTAAMRKTNSTFKQLLKHRLGSDPFIVETIACIALLQILINLEFLSISVPLEKGLSRSCMLSIEIGLQKLSLAMGSPYFHSSILNPGLFPEITSKGKKFGIDSVIQVIRRRYGSSSFYSSIERLLDDYDEQKRLDNMSPEKSISSQSTTKSEENDLVSSSIIPPDAGAPTVTVAIPTKNSEQLKRTTSLITKKPPVLGHRTNMGIKRSVTVVSKMNPFLPSTKLETFLHKANEKGKTIGKRVIEEVAPSQKHVLTSPNPIKRARTQSSGHKEYFQEQFQFGNDSFISPQSIGFKKSSVPRTNEIIDNTPIKLFSYPHE